MGGGLMQLVAYGAQDIYLTGNPQITFFKVVYRRHTNFSMEAIEQTFNGGEDFGKSVSATISRNGDLVHRMYLEHKVVLARVNDKDMYVTANYGHRLIKEVELEIGGQRIDKHYGHWMSVWSQLTEPNPSGHSGDAGTASDAVQNADSGKRTLFDKMSGNGLGCFQQDGNNTDNLEIGAFTLPDENGAAAVQTNITGKMFIPLQFWFCRNPGLALPLIALQYHEVKVKMTFNNIGDLFLLDGDADPSGSIGLHSTATPSTKEFKLFADYIYLDTDERRRFAQVSHEYLIEQVQHAAYNSSTDTAFSLNFNHPVKELVWSRILPEGSTLVTPTFDDSTTTIKTGSEATIASENWTLKLNGHERFKARNTKYFTRTQIWQHHTGYGSTINSDAIAVYSFALKPEEHQPSGTCNFSRIDNAELSGPVSIDSSSTPGNHSAGGYNIYAVNYNVLRIMSGMGGLAYSN